MYYMDLAVCCSRKAVKLSHSPCDGELWGVFASSGMSIQQTFAACYYMFVGPCLIGDIMVLLKHLCAMRYCTSVNLEQTSKSQKEHPYSHITGDLWDVDCVVKNSAVYR